MKRSLIFAFVVMLLFSCKEEGIFTPKPRMFPRVEFPVKAYKEFSIAACHFTFQKPEYATIKTGITFFGEKAKHPCWFDLEIEKLNTSLHFSYTKIDGENTLEKLVRDAFKIVEEHNAKAKYTEEILLENKNGVKGLMFNLEGPVASPINFFLTDTLEHFVRASLYFNSAVDPDSTQIILDFVSEDVDKILSTFAWKE
ncbi:MAG: gliding motility-associated lipoprotein GldD [Saprospiraceae bacterium]|jgi:gliding motility-associated lipoprotein GldD|tara:strand:- start:3835 stop:4428 length:594 start_codon:yes stop_codon:yes gene_type:complete